LCGSELRSFEPLSIEGPEYRDLLFLTKLSQPEECIRRDSCHDVKQTFSEPTDAEKWRKSTTKIATGDVLKTCPSYEYFMSHFPLSRIYQMQAIRINANGRIRVVGPLLLFMA